MSAGVLREVHDGLVSRLMSTLVALERGSLSSADVLEVLRDCVDDSRMFVDSLEPIGHDLVVLLATVRHRVGPRLRAAGLNVRWEVTDVPLLPWLGSAEAFQLMRNLQEALTNVLKHAGATTVRIATRLTIESGEPQRVIIEIEDNGVGFEGRDTKVTFALPLQTDT